MPLKKIFRGAKKVVKAPVRFVRKIVPRELKPFAPYIAASFIPAGGFGGSGRVIIRRETAASCTTSGSVSTSGDDTIHEFNSSGTYVA